MNCDNCIRDMWFEKNYPIIRKEVTEEMIKEYGYLRCIFRGKEQDRRTIEKFKQIMEAEK